ncbi:hypothetical protein MTO96_028198 [Rhipicephalus appendiculatus]
MEPGRGLELPIRQPHHGIVFVITLALTSLLDIRGHQPYSAMHHTNKSERELRKYIEKINATLPELAREEAEGKTNRLQCKQNEGKRHGGEVG